MGARKNYKESYKDFAVRAAKELGYGKTVILQIEMAETDAEVEHIMVTARHQYFGD